MRAILSIPFLVMLTGGSDAPKLEGLLQGEDQNVFARASFENWTAIALRRQASNYGGNNRVDCAIKNDGAIMLQSRPQESNQMHTTWSLFDGHENDLTNLSFVSMKISGKKYQMTSLPWRLIGFVGEDDIVTMSDIRFIAFRKSEQYEWLPLSFLANEMFEARSFTISYQFQDDKTRLVRSGTKTFDLAGFKEAAKWCGRQLLSDRIKDGPHVSDLVK